MRELGRISELLGEREKCGLNDVGPRKKMVGPASTGQTGRPYWSDRSGQTDKKIANLWFII